MPLARTQTAYDRFSEAVETPLTVLAVLWLPALVAPIVADLPTSVRYSLDVFDYAVWAAFVVEYLAKLYLAPSRRRFVAHHVLELVVIVVPVVRPLRGLELFRLLELGRVGVVLANALRRTRALLTHHRLHFVLLSVVGILFACAALVLLFERHAKGSNIHDFGQALWWAVVTATTVGYGTRFPVTAAGQGVAVVLMLVGVGLIGVLTATVASYFVEAKAEQEKTEIEERLDRIEAMLVRLTDAGSDSTPGW